MKQKHVSRRSMLKGGGAALAGLSVMQVAGPAQAFPGQQDQDEQIAWNDQADSPEALRHSGGQVLPWLDQPPPNPVPQITGELRSVEFTEGQDVRKGQLLFTIDPRPFEASLKQSEAALARDTAQSKNLEAQRVRLENLLKSGLVARADYEAAVATVSAMEASLNAGAAAVEQARLQLQYTRISAPINGRTGALLFVHREDDVGPLEHALVDAHQSVPARACGADIEVATFAEHALGGGTAVAVYAADEEDPPEGGGMRHQRIRVILAGTAWYSGCGPVKGH